jgi:hypothetical protein
VVVRVAANSHRGGRRAEHAGGRRDQRDIQAVVTATITRTRRTHHQLKTTPANLGTDRLDVYFFHSTDFGLAGEYLSDAIQLMHIGLSAYENAPAGDIRGATRRAFEVMVDLAVEEQVIAVLLAGDLFDGEWRDYSSGMFCVKGLRRLREAGGGHHSACAETHSGRCSQNSADGAPWFAWGDRRVPPQSLSPTGPRCDPPWRSGRGESRAVGRGPVRTS